MPTKISWSRFLITAIFVSLPAAAGIPPFCAEVLVPPSLPGECRAEKALPCTGACPGDGSNSVPDRWASYWDHCTGPKHTGLILDPKFMCGSDIDKLKIVYYTPVDRYICCVKTPWVKE